MLLTLILQGAFKEKCYEKIPSWSILPLSSDNFLDAAIDRQGELMNFSPHDQRIIDHLNKAESIHPHWKRLFSFHRELIRVQATFKELLRNEDHLGHLHGKDIDSDRLAAGIPQIEFGDLRIEESPFINLYSEITNVLIRDAEGPSSDKEEPQPEEIFVTTLEIFNRGTPLVGVAASDDLLSTASGLALAPYLQLASEYLMPRINKSAWHRGHCPVCGGSPSFAVVQAEPDFRTLLCSRCNGEWLFRRLGCPFCLERDYQTYYVAENGEYRLYVCEKCNRYLKTIDRQASGSEERCLPVENMITFSMDIAAREKGWLFF